MISNPIALASSSPRRLQLLQSMDLKVRTLSINFKETVHPSWTLTDIPAKLAHYKNRMARDKRLPGEVLITADTIVVVDDQIMQKPRNADEAESMLRQLSNGWHEVITGVCLYNEKEVVLTESTRVHMTELSPVAITYYVNTYRPFDKAGSYGIQEWIGWSHIDRIEGSFSNVMGLPTNRVFEELTMKF